MKTLERIVAATLLAVASSMADAAVVVFNNFDLAWKWEPYSWLNTFPHQGRYYTLDVTKSAAQQLPSPQDGIGLTANTFAIQWDTTPPNFITQTVFLRAGSGAAYANGVEFVDPVSGRLVRPPKMFGPDAIVGPSEDYAPIGNGFLRLSSNPQNYQVDFSSEDAVWGVRVQIAGQTHYGFVRFRHRPLTHPRWFPIQWGYESEPNTAVTTPHYCPADVDESGAVDTEDLAVFLSAFGLSGPQFYMYDLTGDLRIDTRDLVVFLQNFACTQ